MAERDKEELARALEGIGSGNEADGGQSAPTPKPRPGKPRPAAPEQVAGAPRLVPPRPVVPAGAVPVLPGARRPIGPPTPDADKAVPAVPSAHLSPTRPPAPARPAVPSIPPSAQIPAGDSAAVDQEVSDDDDMVIVPAPSSDVFAHRHHPPPAHAPRRLAAIKSLDARRTVIPILLTIGVVLVATSTLRLLTSPDTPLSTLPRWVAWAGYIVAALLFAVALLNMLYVRHELARASSADAPRV